MQTVSSFCSVQQAAMTVRTAKVIQLELENEAKSQILLKHFDNTTHLDSDFSQCLRF